MCERLVVRWGRKTMRMEGWDASRFMADFGRTLSVDAFTDLNGKSRQSRDDFWLDGASWKEQEDE